MGICRVNINMPCPEKTIQRITVQNEYSFDVCRYNWDVYGNSVLGFPGKLKAGDITETFYGSVKEACCSVTFFANGN